MCSMQWRQVVLCFLFIVLSMQSVWAAPEIDLNTDQFPKGNSEPTAEEKSWWEANQTIPKQIQITNLGVQRIQNHQQAMQNSRPQQAIQMTTQMYHTLAPGDELPMMVDNSLLDAFPPIRSQVGGSCQSWCTTYYQLTHMVALDRGWDAKNGGDAYRMSPRWTYNFINGGQNSGGSMTAAVRLEMRNGAARWCDFYADVDPVYRAWPMEADTYRRAAYQRVERYGSISQVYTDEKLDELKAYLNNGDILYFGTYINSWHGTTISDDPNETLDTPWVGEAVCYYMDSSRLGSHGMTVVGYNDTLWTDVNDNGLVDAGEKGALKIANSWGDHWNNDGFIWLAYDALRPTSSVAGAPTNRSSAFSSATWIQVKSQYVPQIMAIFYLRTSNRSGMGLRFLRTAIDDQEPYPDYTHSYSDYVIAASYAGTYGFDGLDYSSQPQNAPGCAFVMDLTDLVPLNTEQYRYVARLSRPSSGFGDIDLSQYTLFNPADGNTLGACTTLPLTVTPGDSEYPYVDAPEQAVWLRPEIQATEGTQEDPMQQVRIFPSPWRRDRHGSSPIYFNHLPLNSTVKIYNSAGRLCKVLDAPQGYVRWDLVEEAGNQVGRGVYFYSVVDTSGNHREGKFAIIR